MSGKLPSGHTYKELVGVELEVLQKRHAMCTEGIVVANPGNFYFPKPFMHFAESIYNFEIKPTDTFVLTYPKSGTNWMQEIVWNLVENPDLKNPKADIPIDSRCPYLEIDYIFAFKNGPKYDPKGKLLQTFFEHFPAKDPLKDGVMLHLAKIHPDPRLLKNHLPYTFLPPDMLKKTKVICLARDPRDVIVSSYHFHRLHMIFEFKGTLEDFAEDFMNDRDLKENPKTEIRKIDKFLGTKRTDEQIENIVKYTSFSNMKERTKHNPPTSFDNVFFNKEEIEKGGSFFRKGKPGTWKEEFSPELQKKVNSWMKKNLTRFEDDFKYKAEFLE